MYFLTFSALGSRVSHLLTILCVGREYLWYIPNLMMKYQSLSNSLGFSIRTHDDDAFFVRLLPMPPQLAFMIYVVFTPGSPRLLVLAK